MDPLPNCMLKVVTRLIILVLALPLWGDSTDARFGVVKGVEELVFTSGNRKISEVCLHLNNYSQSREDRHLFKPGHEECGIGAIIRWVDRLRMVTRARHKSLGSDHKLYSIDQDLNITIYAESVGGTPAARMIHAESERLCIAHYELDKEGNICGIDRTKMPARVTAIMRHLIDPENYVYDSNMEHMFYELNVHTLDDLDRIATARYTYG